MAFFRPARRGMAWGVAVLLLACGGTYVPPLTTRGVPAEERRDYVIQNGYGIPEHVKQAFLDGYLTAGMSKEMVYHLFGAPDRSSDKDTHWEYVDRRGNLITGVHYQDDKIGQIDGDPAGGAKKPAAEAPVPGL